MSLPIFRSELAVTVYKRIERRASAAQRVSGSRRQIDLSPFLGDGCSVQVAKNIRGGPGTFTITLNSQADRTPRGSLDSLAAILEPMDYVEIRMARDAYLYPTTPGDGDSISTAPKLPIVMRGFIGQIRSADSLAGGQPTRRVIITGQDFGKVPQMVRIMARRDLANKNFDAFLSSYALYVKFGIDNSAMAADSWMQVTVSRILNGFLARLAGFAQFTGGGVSGPLPLLKFEPGGVPGAVGGFGIQPFEGTMQGFMETYADLSWNELFIEDREDGPYVVYRPIPFTPLGNDEQAIQGRGVPRCVDRAGKRLELPSREVLSAAWTRSDQNVVNIVFVEAPNAELNSIEPLQDESLLQGKNFISGNPNCAPELYGDRYISAQSNQVSPNLVGDVTKKAGARSSSDNSRNISWFGNRRDVLKALNQDNALFEEGIVTCKGHELIKPGRYLTFKRGSLRWQAYVTGVTHTFIPFQSFTSSVTLERGTNFYERTRLSQSAYPSEVGRGAYGT